MNWTRGIILLVLGLCLGCVEKAPKIDWTVSFDSNFRHPYGTYILKEELTKTLPEKDFVQIETGTEQFFKEQKTSSEFYTTGNYTFIYPSVFHASEVWKQYDVYTHKGGVVFLSKHSFPDSFLKDYKLSISKLEEINNPTSVLKTNEGLYTTKEFSIKKGIQPHVFTGVKGRQDVEVLGYIHVNGEAYANFIKVNSGSGYYLLHSSPFAFTNYHLLEQDHYKYVMNCLAHLQPGKLLWDNNAIASRRDIEKESEGGFFAVLSFVKRNEMLRNALYLLFTMAILAGVFNYKRRFRVQTFYRKPENKRIQFTKTLASLYDNKADHAQLIAVKANYFLVRIKKKYGMDTRLLNEVFAEQLAYKSGVGIEECVNLTHKLKAARERKLHTYLQFTNLEKQLQLFIAKAKL